jgi:predicted PurR-regulated permease PerM
VISWSNMESQQKCPHCGQTTAVSSYFCSNCGKKLKDKLLSTTILKQIFIYLLSFLLPPLGLWPAVRYLRQKDEKSRIIGFVAIFLTIISIIVTIWLYLGFLDTFTQQLNQQLNNNLNLYH